MYNVFDYVFKFGEIVNSLWSTLITVFGMEFKGYSLFSIIGGSVLVGVITFAIVKIIF